MSTLFEGELPLTPCADDGGAISVPLPEMAPRMMPASSSRVVGPAQWRDGVEMVPVLFATHAPARSRILVHLSGWTDRHRHSLAPSLLENIAGTAVHARAFLLPADGIVSYRIADVSGLPDDIGRTRDGWRRVHRLGRPDPSCPESIPTPLGGDASLWRGPRVAEASWPTHETQPLVSINVDDREMTVLPGDQRTVVLLDGQFWTSLAPGAGLRAAGLGHTVVLVPSRMADREAEMTTSDAAARLVERGLAAASRVLGLSVERAFALAGQSYGGLATAEVAADRPELLVHAIVQSGSFWYPDKDGHSSGALVGRLQRGQGEVSVPVRIQVGSEEDGMVLGARSYRDALLARGGPVTYHEARGGHDYAWWREGLVAALAALESE